MEQGHLNDIKLFEYAGGELAGSELRAAEEHLAACDECRTQLALAQAGGKALRGAATFELPPEALDRALDSLGPQELEPAPPIIGGFPLRRWLTILAPAAAIAGVIVLVIFAARGDDDVGGEASEDPPPAAAPAEAPAQAPADADERTLQSASPDESAADAAGGTAAEELSAEPLPAESAEPAPAAAPEPAAEPAPEAAESAPALPEEEAPAEAPAQPAVGEEIVARVGAPAQEVVDLLAAAGIDAAIADDGAVEVAPTDAEATAEALAGLAPGEQTVRVAPDGRP